jgi:hypothetical protein
MNTVVSPGKSFPIGVTVYPSGVNFSFFARGNTAVELLLFDQADDSYPSRTITLDPVANPQLSLLACLCARNRSGPDLRVSCRWVLRPGARVAI